MTAACVRCHRPCVGGRTPLDRVPTGHVRYQAKGLCHSCYTMATYRATGWQRPKVPCPECGALRVVKAGRSGLCRTCSAIARNIPDTEPVYDEAEVALTAGRWVPNGRGTLIWREDKAA